ncbi:MAG TPA: AHH domain-containing protein [Myxococcaceae bacterium]|nr:AHH domain-containing protein [Myxococcaceae bacterium]
MLVQLQLELDQLQPVLASLEGRSFSTRRVEKLTSEVLATAEYLAGPRLDEDGLRAARYRVDLIGVAYDLLRTHAELSARGLGGVVRTPCSAGMTVIAEAQAHLAVNPRWLVESPREADRLLLTAVDHRSNAMRVAPAVNVLRPGVQAAAFTSGVASTIQLTRTGLAVLTRLAQFLADGGGMGVLEAGAVAGVGSVRLVASGRALVLTTEELVGLVKAGVISTASFAVYLEAAELHHICTDKNSISDRTGGPWTPLFEDLFRGAGKTLDDPDNLVRVPGHRGPHPQAYHEAVMDTLSQATRRLQPGTPEYRQALEKALRELAKEITTPGTPLNDLVIGLAHE